MVYVQKRCVTAVLGGRPQTAAYQLVQLHVIMTLVMSKRGSVTVPVDIQVYKNYKMYSSLLCASISRLFPVL